VTNLIVERGVTDPSATFDQMAERIRHNADQGFGGAVVIQPPAQGGPVVAFMLLDETQDPVQFWTLVQSKAAAAIAELGDAQVDPFGQRRR